MTQSEQPPQTYEVTLPHGSRDQELALHGLAGTFGWNLRRTTAFEAEREVITGETLETVSTEIWGQPVYGTVAADLLQNKKWPPTLLAYQSRLRLNYPIYGDVARQRDTAATVERHLRLAWDTSNSPFELNIEKPPSSRPEEWALSLGDVTKDRLARFVVVRRWHASGLHGTLGKTFEVLSLAAGLIYPDEVDPHIAASDNSTFVSYTDFDRRLREADMPSSRRRAIRKLISDTLSVQIERAEANNREEIVVEGRLITRDGYKYQPERIAARSLDALSSKVSWPDQCDFLRSFEY